MNKYEDITAECEKRAVPDNEIDTSEIPAVSDFSGFHFGNQKYFKPKKEQVSIRFNTVLVEHFRSMGKGWQTKLNDFLMESYAQGKIQRARKARQRGSGAEAMEISTEPCSLLRTAMFLKEPKPQSLFSEFSRTTRILKKLTHTATTALPLLIRK